MLDKFLELSWVELLAFIGTAGIIIGLLILLPIKIRREIEKQKK